MKIYQAKLTYELLSLGEEVALDQPDVAADYVRSLFDEDPTVEWFVAVLLDRKNHPLGRIVVSKGTASSCLVHPREVFKPAIVAGASSVLVAHNHPSGDPSPSRADIQITRELREAAKILQIDLIDHIIVGDKAADPQDLGLYSFSEAGLI
jgi:DNA repair protein RadC